MRAALAALIAATSLCGCASENVYDWRLDPPSNGLQSQKPIPATVSKLRVGAVLYKKLRGTELKSAIEDKSMRFDGRDLVTSADPQRFFKGGEYSQNRDRVGPAFGRFEVRGDEVCTYLGDTLVTPPTSCFALLRNERGELLIVQNQSAARVFLTPL